MSISGKMKRYALFNFHLFSIQQALANALRYFPSEHHEMLSAEFAKELQEYGHVYMYRFLPEEDLR